MTRDPDSGFSRDIMEPPNATNRIRWLRNATGPISRNRPPALLQLALASPPGTTSMPEMIFHVPCLTHHLPLDANYLVNIIACN